MGTGTEIDVPTLRGLSSTPPYGHDGRWDSIAKAVQAMLSAGEIVLSAREREQLVEYLKLF
jgi:cytochrome c peroxidase